MAFPINVLAFPVTRRSQLLNVPMACRRRHAKWRWELNWNAITSIGKAIALNGNDGWVGLGWGVFAPGAFVDGAVETSACRCVCVIVGYAPLNLQNAEDRECCVLF